MNKENAILKINKMGAVGKVITTVLTVLLSIGAAVTLIALIAIAVLPKDFVTLSVNSNIGVDVNLKEFESELNSGDPALLEKQIQNELNSGSITVNGTTREVSTVEIDNGVMSIMTNTGTDKFTLGNLIPVLVSVLFTVVFGIISSVFATRLCKAFKVCTSPFDADVIKKLQQLAYSFIPLAIIYSVTEAFSDMVFGNNSFTFSVNLTMIFVILVLLFLAYIFKYGAVLQQESDETL